MWLNSKRNTQLAVISMEAVDSPAKSSSQFLRQGVKGIHVFPRRKKLTGISVTQKNADCAKIFYRQVL